MTWMRFMSGTCAHTWDMDTGTSVSMCDFRGIFLMRVMSLRARGGGEEGMRGELDQGVGVTSWERAGDTRDIIDDRV